MALVQKVYPPDAMPQVALIGNKADLTHMRAVHLSEHNEFAGAHSMYRCRSLLLCPIESLMCISYPCQLAKLSSAQRFLMQCSSLAFPLRYPCPLAADLQALMGCLPLAVTLCPPKLATMWQPPSSE